MKNILIDIAHPAHVHLLRNTYFALITKGYHVVVTVKNIPSAIQLLNLYHIPFIYLGDKKDGLLYKGLEQFIYNWRLMKIVFKHKIDIGIGTSITIPHVSKLTRMKSIVLDDDDDDVEPLFVKYAHPFCDTILSPACTTRKSKHTLKVAAYHELAYLYPSRFTPDESVLHECGLSKDDIFFILRFNAFKAHHDVGVKGLSIESKRKIISVLESYGQVFITTERHIDDEFKKYQLKISPEKAHSLLAFASIFIGDSQTMTSEAAVLGVPSIRCNSFVGRISYLEEEEHKYGLTYGIRPDSPDELFTRLNELLVMPERKLFFQQKRKKLLNDKIDYTAFLTWFVENYPESKTIMQQNPDYQYRFK